MIDFRYRRWCESNDIAWEDFTSLIIDPAYSASSLLRVLKANGLDTTDGSLRSLRRRLETPSNTRVHAETRTLTISTCWSM